MDDLRDQILKIVEREMIGPDPIDWEGYVQPNGEEILFTDPPRQRYIAGILFPQETRDEYLEPEEVTDVSDNTVENGEPETEAMQKQLFSDTPEFLEDAEELINRSNAYRQSAMSITAAVLKNDSLKVKVSAASYVPVSNKDPESGFEKTSYHRKPIIWNNDNQELNLPTNQEKNLKFPIADTGLQLVITSRISMLKHSIFTFSLENTKRCTVSSFKDEDCFFQVKYSLYSELGFQALPPDQKVYSDNDFTSNQLLYRDVFNYAIGHGCAADWDTHNGKVSAIHSTIFPLFELKPIVPSAIPGVLLDMHKMSISDNYLNTLQELETLCANYKSWIDQLRVRKTSLESQYQEAAERHIKNCEQCHHRMIRGVNLLKNNATVRHAFQLMNEAMLMQQLHYNLPLQRWEGDGRRGIRLVDGIEMLPKISDTKTWPGEASRYGRWRPFQLAFILINLYAMYEDNSEEREIVDLIWFPTGGGKTEAYLGLSAYCIFLQRLMGNQEFGSTILMRYTLRLLTAQQYERAAALICACESLRLRNPDLLGTNRITIGLWVGSATTPNKMKDAVRAYEELYNGTSNKNPFVILKCPWCGAQMGPVQVNHGVIALPGYQKIRKNRKYSIVFQCANHEVCDYAKSDTPLPLQIVDESIYDTPPTLLLGTVDKFATLPFRPEAQSIFGIKNGIRVSAPKLIIQDELHLISGPLGSMVGHYETLISELCTRNAPNGKVKPKIVASTATISRAKEQCRALYARSEDQVFQFPPSGLDAGDSFFAYEDKSQKGRKYVGIMATGSSSDATTAIRLYSALLYAAKSIKTDSEVSRDAYWTNIAYFNSIRELGQAATWIRTDIEHHLDVMYKRRFDDKRMTREEYRNYRRYIYRDEELTSRVTGDQLTSTLASLSQTYPPERDENDRVVEYPIDICLATNMISVGLDVPRLGLMTVNGQPKTTAEYIQATSRVGRNAASAPGIVFVLYRPGRPRDKSHYEHFKNYHSKIYSNVEPTSVTPFSSPVRSRAMHAIVVGMLRLQKDEDFNFQKPRLPDFETIEDLREVLSTRVSQVDKYEQENTLNMLNSILENWESWNPDKWTPDYDFQGFGDALPLIYPSGSQRKISWGKRGFPAPTSMRNVDASCIVDVMQNRYIAEE